MITNIDSFFSSIHDDAIENLSIEPKSSCLKFRSLKKNLMFAVEGPSSEQVKKRNRKSRRVFNKKLRFDSLSKYLVFDKAVPEYKDNVLIWSGYVPVEILSEIDDIKVSLTAFLFLSKFKFTHYSHQLSRVRDAKIFWNNFMRSYDFKKLEDFKRKPSLVFCQDIQEVFVEEMKCVLLNSGKLKLNLNESQQREDYDRILLNFALKNLQDDSSFDNFSSSGFINFVLRYISIKYKVECFVKKKLSNLIYRLTAIATSTSLNESENLFEILTEMLKIVFDISVEIENVEKKFKEEECELDNRSILEIDDFGLIGKFVVETDMQNTVLDLFTDSEFIKLPDGKLKLQRIILSTKSKKVLQHAAKPRKNAVFPKPKVILPVYFSNLKQLFSQPLREWSHFKEQWMMINIRLMNTLTIISVLNSNSHFLKKLMSIKLPDIIEETSLAYRGINEIPIKANYKLKPKRTDANLRRGEIPITDHPYSVLLNLIVRADLQYSENVHCCSWKCGGHKGKLLLTALRQDNQNMVDMLLSNGLSLISASCSQQTRRVAWDFPADVRYRIETNKSNRQSSQRIIRRHSVRKSTASSSINLNQVDAICISDPRKTRLVSVYKRIAPLSVAVEMLFSTETAEVVDYRIYERKLRFLEHIISTGADVQEHDFSALRTCLMILSNIIDALQHFYNKKKISGGIKAITRQFTRAKKKEQSAYSVQSLEQLERDLNKLFEKATRKKQTMVDFKLVKAYFGIKALSMLLKIAAHEIRTIQMEAKLKLNSAHTEVVLRGILIHEAFIQEEWFVAKFLLNLYTNLSNFDHSLLKFIIRRLLDQLACSTSCLTGRALNALFYIMNQFNLILPKNQLYELVLSLKYIFKRNVCLKAAERNAMTNILSLNQIQSFLFMEDLSELEYIELTCSKNPSKSLEKLLDSKDIEDIDLFELRSELFSFIISEELFYLGKLQAYEEKFSQEVDSVSFTKLLYHCLVDKNNSSLCKKLYEVAEKSNLLETQWRESFEEVLSFLLDASRGGIKIEVARSIGALIEIGIEAVELKDCKKFLVKLLMVPQYTFEKLCIFGLCETKPLMADLSHFTTLRTMTDYVCEKGNSRVILQVLKALRKASKHSSGDIWLEGIEYFIRRANQCLDLSEEYNNPKSALPKITRYFNRKKKWELQYLKQNNMLLIDSVVSQK